MATPAEFAQSCRAAAKGLRRVQPELRRTLGQQVREEVATPLASRVAAAAAGPWARVLSAGVKARQLADPTIVVGGARPRLSGGAGPRQVVFGAEFGGGKRLARVPAGNGHRGYRRYSTNQFRRNRHAFVFPTVRENVPWVLDRFATITLDVLNKEVNRL